MSIVDKWIERAEEKYGSKKAGIQKLNQICNMSIRESELSAFKTGKRGVPKCVFHVMMIDVLFTELENAGWKNAALDMGSKTYINLIESLTPPKTWEDK